MLQRSMRVVPLLVEPAIIGDSHHSWAGLSTGGVHGADRVPARSTAEHQLDRVRSTSDGLTVVLAERLREGERGLGWPRAGSRGSSSCHREAIVPIFIGRGAPSYATARYSRQ
jgi:hypothetical protein